MLKYGADPELELQLDTWRQKYEECVDARRRGRLAQQALHAGIELSLLASVFECTERALLRELSAVRLDKHVYDFLVSKLSTQELMLLLDEEQEQIVRRTAELGYLPTHQAPSRRGRPRRAAATFDDVALIEAVRVIDAQFGGTGEEIAERLQVPPFLIYRLRPLLTLSPAVLTAGRTHQAPRQLMLRLEGLAEPVAMAAIKAYADGTPLAGVVAELGATHSTAHTPKAFGVHPADLFREFVHELRGLATQLMEQIEGDADIFPATTMAVGVIELLADRLEAADGHASETDADAVEDLLLAAYRRRRDACMRKDGDET